MATRKKSTAKVPASKQSSAKKQVATKKQPASKQQTASSSVKRKKVETSAKPKQKTQSKSSGLKAVRVKSESTSKKSKGRKLKKLEVRNSKNSSKKKSSKINLIKPQRKADSPLIFDEKRYLKRLKRRGRKIIVLLTAIFGLFALVSLAFVIRLQVTHTKNGYDLEEYAQQNYTETTSIQSRRGTIYDTNGESLAINLEVYDLRVVTSKDFECNIDSEYVNCALEDSAEASKQMAEALGFNSKQQAYIKERIDFGLENDKYEVTFGSYGKNITLSQKKALEALELPWIQFTPQELRFYPYGDFASYIIGYTTKDQESQEIKGQLGVEKALDGHLRGQDGIETSLFDNYGIELTEAQQSAIPKIDGTDVYLTLDSVIQTYLESSMEKALSAKGIKDIEYDGLFTIVMDAKTGDILAAQSYPTFDPNVREIENYTNYFTNYCFEPGSTFKIATMAAADESGVWNSNASQKTGSRSASTWGGATIKDWNDGVGWGTLNWDQGFYMSANTVMTYIMDKIPGSFWLEFVSEKLLIGQPVTTQFIETPSCVFNPKYDVDYATTSFGQGLTVNTLQMLRMYSALVGDGNMVTPHIVETIKDSDTGEVIYTDEDLEVVKNVVSEETSEHMRKLLDGVVNYDNGTIRGTGNTYRGGNYDIGMKTGTAQMVGDNGKYEKNKYIYSAMTVAPVEDPELIIYAVVIAPNDSSIVYQALPEYIKEVYDNSLSYLNSENREIDINDQVETRIVGDYIGKDMKDIKSKRTIKIGNGEITDQYPKAGQRIPNDQKVVLFGTDNLKFPNLKGKSYNEAVAICNGLKATCEFSNTGTSVKSVTSESKNKYKIKME